VTDPFDTEPEPQGPQHFERGGKPYVRDSRLGEFFNFLASQISKGSTMAFVDSLYRSWDKYGTLSLAQYESLMSVIDDHGGVEEALENAPPDYDPYQGGFDEDADEFYYGE
jgi:hypothetical protein